MKMLSTKSIALALLTFGVLMFGGVSSTFAACNNRLLHGAYGFTVQGTKLGGQGPTGPQVGVAMAQFDGNGNFTQTDTVTINGQVVADFTHTPASGTYEVSHDCTGSFTINFTDGRPTVTTSFVVVQSGNEIDTVVTSAGGNPGVLATGSVGKRVTSRSSKAMSR
jgi:hypothetical protein